MSVFAGKVNGSVTWSLLFFVTLSSKRNPCSTLSDEPGLDRLFLRCSTLCLVRPWLIGNWQKRTSIWARRWNIPNKSHPNQGSPADAQPAVTPEGRFLKRGSIWSSMSIFTVWNLMVLLSRKKLNSISYIENRAQTE